MKFLNEGDKHYVQGSGKNPYEIKKVGGVVSCSCPAWRNLGGSIDTRVCKHIKKEIDPACLLPQAVSMAAATSVAASNQPDKSATNSEPPLLLAHTLADEDPTGWWISEKLDGVRAYWDGSKFISRLGNEYHAPAWFKAAMPKGIKLDGELFSGRKRFQETVSIVRKHIPDDNEWKKIKYMVFDVLDVDEPFENRIERGCAIEKQYPGYCQWVAQTPCFGIDHLYDQLKQIEAVGGEGLMLRQPGSKYEAGRSHSLLRVKSFFDDEATVIGVKPGKGKHKGRMGALSCQLKNGKEFDVGTGFTDAQRKNPPKVGTKITYRYSELTRDGIPRFPRFVTARDYE